MMQNMYKKFAIGRYCKIEQILRQARFYTQPNTPDENTTKLKNLINK